MQSIVQNEAEFNQKIDQQAQVASDPVLATQSMIDEFKKINVLADRSDAEIIADVKKKVASGMSIGKALSELKAGFMSKPSYANFVESNKYRAPSGTSDKPFVVSDGSAVYDPATGTFKYPGGANTI